MLAIAAPATAAQWFPAAPMHEPRAGQTATLLPDGEVLVAGGYHIDNTGRYKSSRSTELFNPTTNTWRPAAPMLAERYFATATLLTNGDVLITGGERYISGSGGGFRPEVPAETYDPSTNIWTPFPSPELSEVSGVVRLPSGRLFALGYAKGSLVGSIYNPATNMWEQTAAAAHPRQGATLVLLKDGNVLAIGGFTITITEEPRPPFTVRVETAQDTVEEYDPLTNMWRELAQMREARSYETAAVLPDGDVFVDGGEHELSLPVLHINGGGQVFYGTMLAIVAGVTSAEQYDPASDRWVSLAPMSQPRAAQTTTLLDHESLLVTGGDQCGTGGCLDSRPEVKPCTGNGCGAASAELYEPNTGTWTFTPPVISGQNHTATLLPNGAVLVTGGNVGTEEGIFEPATVFSSAEIYAERYPPDETAAHGPTGATPTPPRIERISQSHKRWRKRHVGSTRRIVGHRRPPVGTTFAVTLNESAKIGLTFTQIQHGHRVHDGTLSFAGHAGTNKIAFSGRIGKARVLASGKYTVTIVASNAAGRSAAKRLSFTITN